ncbi:MAG TPA: TonB-dependent receptor, partial [Pricia sp.]|nr:TonB-dependent receptor [Pricia sp.]
YSLRSNLDIDLTDKLSAQVNLYGSNEKSFNLVSNGTRTSPDVRAGITSILGWDPTLPIRNSEGDYNLTSVNGNGLTNPIAQRRESESYQTTNSINANINLSYDITDNLNFSVIGGILYNNVLGENYFGIPAGSVLGPPAGGGNSRNATTLQNSNILTWNKDFGKSNFKFTGLYELQSVRIKGLNANGGPFSIPANFYSLDLGTTPSVGAFLRPSEIESWMARGEYNLDRNLFLTATIRSDKSSRFRPGNQVGYFPSGSIAYQFRDLFGGAVERFKIRGGYGETGNQDILPFTTFSDLETGADYPLNGTALSRGFILGNLGNPDLTWETTKQTNIGADATFLNGRLNLTLNKYWKNTIDLLLNVPLPTFVGGGNITRNVGEVFNGGWEVSVDAVAVDLEKINWNFNLNYSYNQNEVKSLSDDQTEIFFNPSGGLTNSAGQYVRIAEGEALGDFYGATFLGTHKTGDADVTPGEANYLRDADDAVALSVIGNGVPTHTWALNNTITLGNFDINFLLRGVHDFDVLNVTRGAISQSGGVQSLPTYGENRNLWTPENQTEVPTGGDHFINSTRFVEKGDFIRLSNLAIGYNIRDINFMRSLRVYASGQNLFTITDYQGYDPEASSVSASEGTASSIDYGAYPNSKTFTIGLKIGF